MDRPDLLRPITDEDVPTVLALNHRHVELLDLSEGGCSIAPPAAAWYGTARARAASEPRRPNAQAPIAVPAGIAAIISPAAVVPPPSDRAYAGAIASGMM